MPFKSQKQYQYLAINEPEVFKKFKAEDKREFKDIPENETSFSSFGDFSKVQEQEEFGLISNKNMNDLLTDEQFHSFFNDVDNFDKYTLDLRDFFQNKETPQTINSLNQYLENLGYGPKVIEYSAEILSKSDEERAKEKKGMKEASIIVNPIKKSDIGDNRGRNPNNKPITTSSNSDKFNDILKKEIDQIKEEMDNTNDAIKLIELHNKLLRNI